MFYRKIFDGLILCRREHMCCFAYVREMVELDQLDSVVVIKLVRLRPDFRSAA